MIIALFILIGLIVYLIIGRTLINIFEDNDWVDVEDWKGFAIFIFPLVGIWVLIRETSEYLTDVITEFFTGEKRNRY